MNKPRFHIKRASFLTLLAVLLPRTVFAQSDGTWIVTSQIPIGTDIAKLELDELAPVLVGRYFGLLGQNKRVQGTREGDQVSISIIGELPPEANTVEVQLTGTLTENSGSGTLAVGTLQGTSTPARLPLRARPS